MGGKEESNINGNGKGKFRYMDSERLVDFSVENMAGDSVTDGLHSIAKARKQGGDCSPPCRT
jgi:hypothetical protein